MELRPVEGLARCQLAILEVAQSMSHAIEM